MFTAFRGRKEGYDWSEATFERLMTIDPVTCIGRKTGQIEKRWQKQNGKKDMCCVYIFVQYIHSRNLYILAN